MKTERPNSEANPIDVVGIGFGPSNLSLAIYAREVDACFSCLFFEKQPGFQWHPGMLLDGARMQISFLKDLVSLRNLASPYTFLQYTKAKGRLEHFVNIGQFRPTRLEYQDYLRWAADQFSEQVQYNTAVRRVTPMVAAKRDGLSLFRVEVENVSTQQRSAYFARNVVCAAGGRPRQLSGAIGHIRGVFHSSELIPGFTEFFADQGKPLVFAVAGAGQSAGEVAAFLLERYQQARIHLVISGFALRRSDDSPFVNEHFSQQCANDFYHFSKEKRGALLEELRETNYGSVHEDVLNHLYDIAYADAVKHQQRLIIHACSRLAQVEDRADGLCANIEDRFGGSTKELQCDGIVHATGYERSLDPEILADVFPFMPRDESGNIMLSSSYRVKTSPELVGGFYVQGYGESAFGIGDSLLSLLPLRSQKILEDIRQRAESDMRVATFTDALPSGARPAPPEYPPRCFIQNEPEQLYAAIERFRFATLISVRGVDEPVVTEVPLALDRSRGGKGVLFGHMDKANPHADLLAGRKVLVLFHGPNAYISPRISRSNLLPTWNSMTVRVHGHVALITDRSLLVRGLCGLAEQSENGGRLGADDPRIQRLLDFIVGFEITIEEMIGRFKLSQDRSEPDRRAAAIAMARRTEEGERDIIEYVIGLPMNSEEAVSAVAHDR